MDNVVSLGSERPRPRRTRDIPPSGARILFFTGVRYCRDEDAAIVPDAHVIADHQRRVESGLGLERATR